MQIPTVWIIIPTFNGFEITRGCLGDLSRQTYGAVKVVLSDSGSTDGTVDRIREEFPKTLVVQGHSGWWWTKATNEGLKHALAGAAVDDYIMTLNNDVRVPENYVAAMVNMARQYSRSIIGSAIYDAADEKRLVECGSYIDWRTMKYHFLTLRDFDQSGSCDKLTFLCGKGVVYPVSIFRERGLFEEARLPHYGADQDFIASCKKWGYSIRVQTGVPLYSYENITAAGARESKSFSEKLKLLFVRKSKLNLAVHMRFMVRHCPKRYWLSSAGLLTCRLLGHIFIKDGIQDGPMEMMCSQIGAKENSSK